MENNPVINRIWKEWLEKDRELSEMSKEERLKLCESYQWLYPKETKRFVELESLYSSVHHRSNREEFHKWFYVVCGYILSRVHLGDNSYYVYLTRFRKKFNREKCTSKDFPKQVLLVLGLLGYITELGGWYIYNEGSDKNRGYHFTIDRDKLMNWEDSDVSSTITGMPNWVKSHTSRITFKEKGEDKDRMSWTLHPDWLSERQFESISSVTVLEEGIKETSEWMFSYEEYQDYYHLTDTEQNEIMKDWISYQKLRDLDCGDIGGCKDDSENYAGRFYSCMTNMRSDHRHKFLRLDGELVTEIDISSAQPSFLGVLLYRKTGIMTEWLKQCLNGTFYEWIQEKTNTPEDRKTIKKWMMQYMYSCYQPNKKKDYDKPHKPTYEFRKTEDPFLCFQQRLNKFLKESEPAIYNKIDWYKRNPVFRVEKDLYKGYVDDQGKNRKKKIGEGKWCSNLSYDLVKMEVEYIKKCIHALPEKMKFFTIHDCICVKESESLIVKSIMEKESKEMYGNNITLKLKRENIRKTP